MNRLTKLIDDGLDEIYFEVPSDREGLYNIVDVAESLDDDERDEILFRIAERLKVYEDTGLEPEEIKQAYDMYLEVYSKVSEYADLMRQGLLINLPCKVGDGVYGIDGTSGIITKIHYELSKEWSFETNNFYSRVINWNWFANIGKTVFLTPEEAKKALGVQNE